jgi:hypothetical protein
VTTLTGIGTVYGVDVEGDYLFIAADGSNDILMYDISNPESPNPLGSTAGYYPAWGICVEGNYVYAAEMEAVEVFYFSETESLTLMKTDYYRGDLIYRYRGIRESSLYRVLRRPENA